MSGWSAVAGYARTLPTSRAARVALGFLVLAFCAAPVPGDVGGCDQAAQQLDASAFFAGKQSIDCEHCSECRLQSRTCEQACAAGPVPSEFTEGCIPLVHDGEACLRALRAASCDDYSSYVRDEGASTPTECDFCPRRVQ